MATPSERRWYLDPARVVRLAPVIFAVHVAEETPGFVDWFNSLAHPGIPQELFLTVNAIAFVITALAATASSRTALLIAAVMRLAWLRPPFCICPTLRGLYYLCASNSPSTPPAWRRSQCLLGRRCSCMDT